MDITKELIANCSYKQKNINMAVDKTADILSAWGLKPEIFTNQDYKMLVVSLGSGDKTIILNGHLDVVPAEDAQFLPKCIDEKLYGRGSYDMLGAVAVMMAVIKELSKRELRINLILMLVPTEETDGTIGTKYLINKGFTGDFVICGEPTNLNISIMSKGVLQIKITVFGKSSHSSKPWLGENAIIEAVEIYNEIELLPFTKAKNKFYSNPSISLGKITGGSVINQVPCIAEMEIDIRYLPEQNAGDILNQIKSISNNFDIEIIQQGDAVTTPSDNSFVKTLMDSAKKENDNSKIIVQHGTADTRFFQAVDIPSIEFGPIGANHHGLNEYVEVNSLLKYKKILLDFIKNIEED